MTPQIVSRPEKNVKKWKAKAGQVSTFKNIFIHQLLKPEETVNTKHYQQTTDLNWRIAFFDKKERGRTERGYTK